MIKRKKRKRKETHTIHGFADLRCTWLLFQHHLIMPTVAFTA